MRRERVQLIDCEPQPTVESAQVLLRIVSEALILQDEAEAVLAAVARHDHLGVVAKRGGPVGRRFFALQEQLPGRFDDPDLDRLRAALHTILLHHGMQVATALEFLAVEGRSEHLARQVSTWGTLGAPARLLEEVYRELPSGDGLPRKAGRSISADFLAPVVPDRRGTGVSQALAETIQRAYPANPAQD